MKAMIAMHPAGVIGQSFDKGMQKETEEADETRIRSRPGEKKEDALAPPHSPAFVSFRANY